MLHGHQAPKNKKAVPYTPRSPLPRLNVREVHGGHRRATVPRVRASPIGVDPNDSVASVADRRAAHATSSIALVVNLPAAAGVRPIIADSGVPNSSVGLVSRPSCDVPLRLGVGAGLCGHPKVAQVATNVLVERASTTLNGQDRDIVLPVSTGRPSGVSCCVAVHTHAKCWRKSSISMNI